MAAIKKELVVNLIKAYEKKGMGGQQIMIKLLKRKDQVGKNMQALVDSYVDDGSQTPLEDAGRFFGINAGRDKNSRVAGKPNKNPSVTDIVKSQAASASMGLADAAGGIVQGNKYVADKVNSGVNKVFGTKLDTNALGRYNKEYEQANKATAGLQSQAGRGGGDWIRGGTEIAATLPAYMLTSGSTLPIRAAQQGLVGAVVGGARQADNADQRGMNVLGSAAGSALGQAGGEVVSRAVGRGATRVINAKRGNLNPKAQAINDLGKQYDIPTTVGDIKGGGIGKNIETQLERVPVVGISKLRTTQHDKSLAAATRVSKKFKNLMDETDYKAIPAMQRAAQQGDRNASRVLGIINDAGDDTGKILQASAEVKGWRQSAIATKLYNRVDDEVIKAGNGTVPTNRTQAALADALDKQAASLAPDGVLLRELTKISDNLANPSKPKTFKNTRLLRSQLGDLADKYGSPINGNKAAARVFGDVKKAVDDDIADFATNSGSTAIKTAYKKADKFYAGVMKSKDSAITKAMQSNKPDEVFDKFIKAGKGDAAQNFANSLDDKGRAALRYQMVDDAMTKAWNENKEAFSPAKFAGKFEELAEPYTRLFKGDDKKQMDGFIKLMRHVERAGQFKENPPTGVRLGDVAMIGTALASVPLAFKGASVSLLARTLFTTKAGKNLLLAADNLPPSQQVALDNIMKIATKLASSSGSKQGRETAERVAGTKVSDKESESLTAF
ncbi:hypothetical protein [Psychrobacter sp. 219-2-C]|uniref:hypothetical protein n=2 Tax=Psychrobacter TaxID=497 RepID=UPI003C6DD783